MFKKWIQIGSLALCMLSALVQAAERPFFVFASNWDKAAADVAAQYAEDGDMLFSAISRHPQKAEKMRNPMRFALPASLKTVAKRSSETCATNGQFQVVIYNPEHWEATPKAELDALPISVSKAGDTVKQAGCRYFGVAPDGKLLGLPSTECKGRPSELVNQIDWKRVDFIILQAQRLLSDKCDSPSRVKDYAQFVHDWAEAVRRSNPSIKVVAQMSFRVSDPKTMTEAVKATHDVVDGYYLAYPRSSGRLQCNYCSADNLKQFLTEFRKQ